MSYNNPWQVKIIAKLILSKLPISYRFWKKLGLFEHGGMFDPEYAYNIFYEHYSRVDFKRKGSAFTALELGPGDTLFSAVIAHAFGATCCYMVDTAPYASMDKKLYGYLEKFNKVKGISLEIDSKLTPKELVKECGGIYNTNGLASLKKIASNSVDFIWSHAVLEHIRKSEFEETMLELKRVLRDDGACSHRVDLKDHLGGGINHLRFSSRFWEANGVASAGFYTNRIRHEAMFDILRKIGFEINVIKIDYFPYLPIPKCKLAKEFTLMSTDDLRVSGFDIVLTPLNHK